MITIIFYLPNITNIIIFAKQLNFIEDNLVLLNKFNNFFVLIKGNKYIFNNIYKQITEEIKFKNLDKLLISNYFKKFFQMIFKFTVYIYLTNNYEYYINKEVKQNIKLHKLSKYINVFNDFKYGYDYLINLSNYINNKIKNTI